ncbi:MAG TPA: tetraacyldisaccharide 4'-kinase [Candidatus Hydrothermia bacterium]|nr:tetraacyldisaccharide 4'-kinase [Candidatus Hydrothermae bacterium]MDD3649509.1 tetraacyldisaccharide 4'-kinase [Candidatus Hydrothermia bacterium]MDD5572299.1 tetraacyldisaccharide 4'-kinase [Candidatus Hydrothermia bacterium]HOK23442.1 tetraacyldisaccharide 4'-kinase [Candidatus Hydrothermia bacterium]HOL23962.1 tetraacyldisaccharide 4'-kinase [Candidatus Hydrothermia bacterium]
MFKVLLSELYKIGLNIWYFYDSNLRTKNVLPARVISVGNITLGGSGKTPLTIYIAEELSKRDSVAILSRGYGRNSKGTLVLKGDSYLFNWEQVGDEPFLMWKKLKGTLPVIVGKNRYETGKIAIQQFESHYLILDDGFQYLPLKRDVDIICINQNTILRGDYLVPRGTLRESFASLNRATILVLNVKGDAPNARAIEFMQTYEKPFFVMKYEPLIFYNFEGENMSLSSLRGFDIAALLGIADPESFLKLLQKLGIEPKKQVIIRDHATYPIPKLRQLLKEFDFVVTTEKDLVKYPSFKNFLALEIEVKMDRQEEFLKLL